MAESFSKLFSSILESTIWQEPDHVRLLWIAMLAMCNRKGQVYGSIPGLANRARITVPQVEDALGRFMSPDPYSRTKDFEGRRVQEIEGGWLIINYAKHRKVQDEEAIKESKRDYMRRVRAEESDVPLASTDSTVEENGKNASASASASEGSDRGMGKDKGEIYSEPFEAFWQRYPRKVSKAAAWKSWKRQKLDELRDTICTDVIARWPNGGFGIDLTYVPHPATYLNQRRWEDETKDAKGCAPKKPLSVHKPSCPEEMTDEEYRQYKLASL